MEVSTTLQSYGSRAQGWCFIMLGSISFLGFLSAAIVSRFLPVSENHIAIAITNDSIKKVAWQVVFGSLLMTSHVAAWVGKTTDCIVQILLFSGALDASYHRRCCIFSLAKHEILQACMSAPSQHTLVFSSKLVACYCLSLLRLITLLNTK
ncbi:uncharacterized protein LOC114265342 isoform X1 [Camellia sinensis]|uniref:uncharacterized protein LOC114265342 isoform X1 n=1 Tax=Camellia sinensis TaxID=4442 RepID=UPI0010356C15|nr:uncharacterized protein LOC114265342 isoform X1 [Camellia sinensis]XP_028061924.1 uncharacterized protein LOC114265342 isoform X1 [Camellia sinensis]